MEGAEVAKTEVGEELVDLRDVALEARQTGGALVHSASPMQFVEKATEIATALSEVIESRQLYKVISGRKHVLVEGWTFLGSMMGAFGSSVYAVGDWTREFTDEQGNVIGWEARVEARTAEGMIVGAAESMCTRRESKWRTADDYAIRSMAQTRATSKALRQPLGFVMQLAGFEATPEAEMVEAEPEYHGPSLNKGAPKDWAEISQAFEWASPGLDWVAITSQACQAQYGKAGRKELDEPQVKEYGIRLANTAADLLASMGGRELPTAEDEEIKAAFAKNFDGLVLEGPFWTREGVEEIDPGIEGMKEAMEKAEQDAARGEVGGDHLDEDGGDLIPEADEPESEEETQDA